MWRRWEGQKRVRRCYSESSLVSLCKQTVYNGSKSIWTALKVNKSDERHIIVA